MSPPLPKKKRNSSPKTENEATNTGSMPSQLMSFPHWYSQGQHIHPFFYQSWANLQSSSSPNIAAFSPQTSFLKQSSDMPQSAFVPYHNRFRFNFSRNYLENDFLPQRSANITQVKTFNSLSDHNITTLNNEKSNIHLNVRRPPPRKKKIKSDKQSTEFEAMKNVHSLPGWYPCIPFLPQQLPIQYPCGYFMPIPHPSINSLSSISSPFGNFNEWSTTPNFNNCSVKNEDSNNIKHFISEKERSSSCNATLCTLPTKESGKKRLECKKVDQFREEPISSLNYIEPVHKELRSRVNAKFSLQNDSFLEHTTSSSTAGIAGASEKLIINDDVKDCFVKPNSANLGYKTSKSEGDLNLKPDDVEAILGITDCVSDSEIIMSNKISKTVYKNKPVPKLSYAKDNLHSMLKLKRLQTNNSQRNEIATESNTQNRIEINIDTDSTDIEFTTEFSGCEQNIDKSEEIGKMETVEGNWYRWILLKDQELSRLLESSDYPFIREWKKEVSLWRAKLIVSLCRNHSLDEQDWAILQLLIFHPLPIEMKLSLLYAPNLFSQNYCLGVEKLRVGLLNLIKISENLLLPRNHRPFQWETIYATNNQPLILLKGSIEILYILGYQLQNKDKLLCKEDYLVETSIVARITLDLMIMTEELLLFINGIHQYPMNITKLFTSSSENENLILKQKSYIYTEQEKNHIEVIHTNIAPRNTSIKSINLDIFDSVDCLISSNITDINPNSADQIFPCQHSLEKEVTNEIAEFEIEPQNIIKIPNVISSLPSKSGENLRILREHMEQKESLENICDEIPILCTSINMDNNDTNDVKIHEINTFSNFSNVPETYQEKMGNPEEHIYEEITEIRKQIKALREKDLEIRENPPTLPSKLKYPNLNHDINTLLICSHNSDSEFVSNELELKPHKRKKKVRTQNYFSDNQSVDDVRNCSPQDRIVKFKEYLSNDPKINENSGTNESRDMIKNNTADDSDWSYLDNINNNNNETTLREINNDIIIPKIYPKKIKKSNSSPNLTVGIRPTRRKKQLPKSSEAYKSKDEIPNKILLDTSFNKTNDSTFIEKNVLFKEISITYDISFKNPQLPIYASSSKTPELKRRRCEMKNKYQLKSYEKVNGEAESLLSEIEKIMGEKLELRLEKPPTPPPKSALKLIHDIPYMDINEFCADDCKINSENKETILKCNNKSESSQDQESSFNFISYNNSIPPITYHQTYKHYNEKGKLNDGFEERINDTTNSYINNDDQTFFSYSPNNSLQQLSSSSPPPLPSVSPPSTPTPIVIPQDILDHHLFSNSEINSHLSPNNEITADISEATEISEGNMKMDIECNADDTILAILTEELTDDSSYLRIRENNNMTINDNTKTANNSCEHVEIENISTGIEENTNLITKISNDVERRKLCLQDVIDNESETEIALKRNFSNPIFDSAIESEIKTIRYGNEFSNEYVDPNMNKSYTSMEDNSKQNNQIFAKPSEKRVDNSVFDVILDENSDSDDFKVKENVLFGPKAKSETISNFDRNEESNSTQGEDSSLLKLENRYEIPDVSRAIKLNKNVYIQEKISDAKFVEKQNPNPSYLQAPPERPPRYSLCTESPPRPPKPNTLQKSPPIPVKEKYFKKLLSSSLSSLPSTSKVAGNKMLMDNLKNESTPILSSVSNSSSKDLFQNTNNNIASKSSSPSIFSVKKIISSNNSEEEKIKQLKSAKSSSTPNSPNLSIINLRRFSENGAQIQKPSSFPICDCIDPN